RPGAHLEPVGPRAARASGVGRGATSVGSVGRRGVSTRRLGLAGLAGAAALVAAVTVASRVVGFGRWLVQSFAVGANAVGEAYATANTLPNILFEVVAGG